MIHGYNLPSALQTATISGTKRNMGFQAKLDAVGYEMIADALKDAGETFRGPRENWALPDTRSDCEWIGSRSTTVNIVQPEDGKILKPR